MNMMTLDPQDNLYEDKEPPMDFAQIDRVCMAQLIQLENAGLSRGDKFEETQRIILGTIHEMLRTLAALHPEPPKIIVAGAQGNG